MELTVVTATSRDNIFDSKKFLSKPTFANIVPMVTILQCQCTRDPDLRQKRLDDESVVKLNDSITISLTNISFSTMTCDHLFDPMNLGNTPTNVIANDFAMIVL